MSGHAPVMVVTIMRDARGRARCFHIGVGANGEDVSPPALVGWVPQRITSRLELDVVLAEPHADRALTLVRTGGLKAAMGSMAAWAELARAALDRRAS